MREFKVHCVDSKTGYDMVLSEASYNMAMDWLQKECDKYGREIYRTENNGTNDMWIYVGKPKTGINPMTGYNDVWYTDTLMFHYDESRGYLMRE